MKKPKCLGDVYYLQISYFCLYRYCSCEEERQVALASSICIRAYVCIAEFSLQGLASKGLGAQRSLS